MHQCPHAVQRQVEQQMQQMNDLECKHCCKVDFSCKAFLQRVRTCMHAPVTWPLLRPSKYIWTGQINCVASRVVEVAPAQRTIVASRLHSSNLAVIGQSIAQHRQRLILVGLLTTHVQAQPRHKCAAAWTVSRAQHFSNQSRMRDKRHTQLTLDRTHKHGTDQHKCCAWITPERWK